MKSKTEIFEAVTKVNAKKKPNMMIIELSYNLKLILPHDAGVAIVNALKDAETMEDSYGKDPKIYAFSKDSIRIAPLGYESYEDIKVAQLLHITLAELQRSREPITEPEAEEA